MPVGECMRKTPQRLLPAWMEYIRQQRFEPSLTDKHLAQLGLLIDRIYHVLTSQSFEASVDDYLFKAPLPQEEVEDVSEVTPHRFSREPPKPATAEDIEAFNQLRFRLKFKQGKRPNDRS